MNTTKNLFRFAMLVFASLLIVTTSCKKDEEEPTPTVDQYKVMTDFMEANGMDLSDVTANWIITPDVLDPVKAEKYIIDLRSSADYNLGHIPGAVNTTLANIVTEAGNANGKPIVVVCYTGQTAAHGHVALRLSGYSDCSILKFGMSYWSGDFDSWTANTSSFAIGDANWSVPNTIADNVTYTLPTLSTSKTTASEILAAQVTTMLTNGFQGVASVDVLANPSAYFINNYWAEADVNTYGHIVGAVRNKEDLTLAADGFKNLDKDATVLTYCWTGQTSSLVTAYLNVLGFNAKSIKFGANSMIYDNLQAFKWVHSGDYAYDSN